ncbi:MAG: tetratricopeptide repeat protein [Flavobacteriales bacterium]|nr:tetratricopeptide repeat protein [Flavobacteriales bacterium]
MHTRIKTIGILLLSIFIFFNTEVDAKTYVFQYDIDQLWEDYRNVVPDSSKVSTLRKISSYYMKVDNNASLAENICQIAISIAENGDDILLLNALNNYLEVVDLKDYKNEASEIAFRAKKLTDRMGDLNKTWRTYNNIANFYKVNYNRDEALKYCEYSLDVANNIQDPTYTANSLLMMGICYEGNNDKIEAFKNYMGALSIAEKLQNDQLLISCYSRISKFYDSNKIFEKARMYKQKELDLLLEQALIDSIAIMYVKADFQGLSFNSNNNTLDYNEIFKILDFAERNKNQLLKDHVITIYRSHIIQAGKFDKLKEFYTYFYPKELELLAISEPQLYYRVRALIHEHEGELDSAYYFFNIGAEIIDLEENMVMSASFHKRYGQFLERQNDIRLAINEFKTSLEFAQEAHYIPFALKAAEHLEDLYIKLNDYENALKYSIILRDLKEEFNSLAKQDKMLRLEIDNEAEMRNMLLETQNIESKWKLDKQKNFSRFSTVVGVGILLLAISLWSRLVYIRKVKSVLEFEKNRSDELLLNILPEDIAKELKENGKAEAKQYKRVTVLFTDFEDFTGLSGNMSAKKLVQEVNECFEVFDMITTKYNIEKIKTIGDSYMAVGGLKDTSLSSVKNVVLAAIEMQKYTRQRCEEKIKNGETCFMMRAGIHTGPVVAGIVGAKKFQYDLWGDTVNTASRMENSGMINKVNISRDTYDLLKDDPELVFESRGIVSVKGKGFIEMFFVFLKQEMLPIGFPFRNGSKIHNSEGHSEQMLRKA